MNLVNTARGFNDSVNLFTLERGLGYGVDKIWCGGWDFNTDLLVHIAPSASDVRVVEP